MSLQLLCCCGAGTEKAENFASWLKRQENFEEICFYKFHDLPKDVLAKIMYFRITYGRSFE